MTKEEVKENIRRIEITLTKKYYSKGYLDNCREELEYYKKVLKLWN